MTHGSHSEVTNEINSINRRNALRIFITGLNGQLPQILFSLNPTDLPNALAKAQELESNSIRTNFALEFASHKSERQSKQQNTLRLSRQSHGYNQTVHNNFPQQRHNDYRQLPQRFEPMVLGSSAHRPIPKESLEQNKRTFQQTNLQNPFRQGNNLSNGAQRWQKPSYNTYNNQTRPLFKRDSEPSAQHSIQPPHKNERINNINEDKNTFLDEEWDYPTCAE